MTGPATSRGRIPAALLGASLLRGGVAFLVLFCVVHVVLAATTTGLHPVQIAELVLICVPEGVFAVRREMGSAMSAAAVAMLIAATVLALATLPTDGRTPGYAAWQFGAIAIVLFGFSLTGRYLVAAATMAAIVSLAIAWALLTGQSAWAGVALTVRHVATLFVGTCYAVAFRRASATTLAFRALARQQRSRERAAEAQAAARRAAAEVVLGQAGPLLAAIAEGRSLSPADRRELLVVEGALRDRIRAGRLQLPPLPEAVAAARRRGADVLLLDEAGDEADPMRPLAAAWLAERLDSSAAARYVVRVRQDADSLQATAVADAAHESVRFPLPVPQAHAASSRLPVDSP